MNAGLASAAAAVGLLFNYPAQGVEIIAHRGASHDAPENTVASLLLGWKQGADANELDVRQTKDGKVIVIHDAATKRTSGVDGVVTEQTFAQLRALDAGSWKGSRWQGEKLPSLEEALAVARTGKRLFIEIKTGPEILPELERVIVASGNPPEQLVIIAFRYDTITEARKRFPQLELYWLASAKKGADGNIPTADDLIGRAKAAGVNGLNLDYRFPIDDEFVRRIKSAGLRLYIWTVNNPEIARKLVAIGVDGITTDRPAWLRAQISGVRSN